MQKITTKQLIMRHKELEKLPAAQTRQGPLNDELHQIEMELLKRGALDQLVRGKGGYTVNVLSLFAGIGGF